ncbi:MAG: hypothetical protein HQM08_16910 [Candidatus Riflebacteria bacterium]|nr:hypothetical protein [Candidatus Riflebacteria bacterium]
MKRRILLLISLLSIYIGFLSGCGKGSDVENPIGPESQMKTQTVSGGITFPGMLKLASVVSNGSNTVCLGTMCENIPSIALVVKITGLQAELKPSLKLLAEDGSEILFEQVSSPLEGYVLANSSISIKLLKKFESLTFSKSISSGATVEVFDANRAPCSSPTAAIRATLGYLMPIQRLSFDFDQNSVVDVSDIAFALAWIQSERSYTVSQVKARADEIYPYSTTTIKNLPYSRFDNLALMTSQSSSDISAGMVGIEDVALTIAWIQGGRPTKDASSTVDIKILKRAQDLLNTLKIGTISQVNFYPGKIVGYRIPLNNLISKTSNVAFKVVFLNTQSGQSVATDTIPQTYFGFVTLSPVASSPIEMSRSDALSKPEMDGNLVKTAQSDFIPVGNLAYYQLPDFQEIMVGQDFKTLYNASSNNSKTDTINVYNFEIPETNLLLASPTDVIHINLNFFGN